MKFKVKACSNCRVKLVLRRKYFTEDERLKLEEWVKGYRGVTAVKLYDRIGEMKILFSEQKFVDPVLNNLATYSYEDFLNYEPNPESIQKQRELIEVKRKIRNAVIIRYIFKTFMPRPLGMIRTFYKMTQYIIKGLKSLRSRKLEVALLDAVAITVSVLRWDFATANSIMFLLKIGDLLEEYTHKKAIMELSRSLALNIETVWVQRDGYEEEIPFTNVQKGDKVVVRAGNMIPCDGLVVDGIAMVNQAMLTGESVPVEKKADKVVYAGTVVEEGNIVVEVRKFAGQARIDEIVQLIETSETNKSKKQIVAYNMADRLVKYSFIGFGLTYALTRNLNKALSFLMVDYSCALKLTTPIAIMAAMKECSDAGIVVKGGKYLESLAQADVVIFDKTGTLTESIPTVKEIVPLNGYERNQILKISACLEEHFPHSIANAVVRKAQEEGITHDELHEEVNYVVAHGIASKLDGKPAFIGSAHFIFDDEHIEKDAVVEEAIRNLPAGCSYLFLAIDTKVAGIICIEDPLRENSKSVIQQLKDEGIQKIVMLTGDNEMTAKVIAEQIGVDEFVAQVLPADKSEYVRREKEAGHTVIMVGDGVNDSPALSEADIGISMGSGSDIAREVSDVLIKDDDLEKLVFLRRVAKALDLRIKKSYTGIVTFNTALIGLGLFNIIMPNSSALLHNAGTVLVAANCMRKTQREERDEEYDSEGCKYCTKGTDHELQPQCC